MKVLRRQDRILQEDQMKDLVLHGTYGILSVYGEEGYPYGIPMHYVYDGKAIYVHCSRNEGHKIEALHHNNHVCFTIVKSEDGIKGQSVILFGKASCVPFKRQWIMEQFVEKFVPEFAWSKAKEGIPHALPSLDTYEITIEHMNGKWVDRPAEV